MLTTPATSTAVTAEPSAWRTIARLQIEDVRAEAPMAANIGELQAIHEAARRNGFEVVEQVRGLDVDWVEGARSAVREAASGDLVHLDVTVVDTLVDAAAEFAAGHRAMAIAQVIWGSVEQAPFVVADAHTTRWDAGGARFSRTIGTLPGGANVSIVVTDNSEYERSHLKAIFTNSRVFLEIDEQTGVFELVERPQQIQVMQAADGWRRGNGLVLPGDDADTLTPLPELGRGNMPRIPRRMFAPLGRELSRLVMGCEQERTPREVDVLWNQFVELGGNTFDTAWMYNQGLAEPRLGWWIERRGIRSDVVILDKGAHTPVDEWPLTFYTECTPEAASKQHLESLERLRTDYVDIYMLHRDNPQVPVADFIETLNEHVRNGTIRSFGASNWTLERVAEANAYAQARGLQGFSAVSNQLSLARMVHPVYPGAISAGDPASRQWLAERDMPLFPWSSQARGFFLDNQAHFVPRDAADRKAEDIFLHWTDDANIARKARAQRLAEARGTSAMAVALAWVLHQPFPTFSLVGARTPEELTSSAAATALTLSDDDVRWLDEGGSDEVPRSLSL